MKTYDDGEADCPGDPTLSDVNPDELNRLGRLTQAITAEENPIVQATMAANFVKGLNG